MSVDANALERETLERKDRDELQKIVGALGGKATTRTRKADLIDQILELTGVTTGDAEGDGGSSDEDDAGPADDAKGSDAKGSDTKGSERSDDRTGADADAKGDKGSDAKSDKGAGTKGSDAKDSTARGGGSARRDDRSGDTKGGDPKRNSGGGSSATAKSGDADDKSGDDGSDDKGDQNDGAQNGQGDEGSRRRRRRGRNRDAANAPEEFTGEPIPVVGCLDLRDDGYGFLRVDGMLPSKDDCYVSVKQVRQFGLRKGDVIAGGSRPAFRNEKNPAILRIDTVNGVELESGVERPQFEELAATFATESLTLTVDDEPDDALTRAVDLLAPLGKGSRALVLAPPRSGRTTLLQEIARSVEVNEPDATLVVVLLDERPEEIAEMREVVAGGEVHATPFDAPFEDHVATTELALARARRIAESGDDVVVLLDGLTRLARAAHAGSQGVGRGFGGLDVAALHAAKRAFGVGRNLTDAGSVTLVATANIDTLSEADEAVVDAVMGAATTHIRLDGFAAARRAFPAIDVAGTGTRREDLLVGDGGATSRDTLRRILAELPDGGTADNDVQLDGLLARLRDHATNDELLDAAAKG